MFVDVEVDVDVAGTPHMTKGVKVTPGTTGAPAAPVLPGPGDGVAAPPYRSELGWKSHYWNTLHFMAAPC